MLSATALRRWTTVHRWTSLFSTLNLLVLAVTGLILIFHHEIDEALGTVPEMHGAGGAMLPLGQLVDIAEKTKPGWKPMSYAEDEDHPGRVFLFMAPPGVNDFAQTKPVVLNAFTGEPFEFDFNKTFSGWIFNLHANLFMGFAGELYLAGVGIAFFIALISGAVVYAPFMRNLLFGMLRRERGARVFQLDLHNLVGIATLAWCSVVALTGVILELSRPILAYYQTTDLAEMIAPYKGQPAPASFAPLDKAAAAAQAAYPAHRVSFAIFPGTPLSGDYHYTFFMAAETGVAKRVLKMALIDAGTGELALARESPWYIKGLFASGPLHFGDYAGMPMKIIWALFTLFTIFLCVSGIYLWIARLRSRRAGVPDTKQPLVEQVL